MTNREASYAYTAGLFDARLHMRLRKRGGVEIRLRHQDDCVTKELCRHFGGKRYPVKGGGYEWRMYKKEDIAKTLSRVLPYMAAKRRGAEALRDYCLEGTDDCMKYRLFVALGGLDDYVPPSDPSELNF